MGLISGLGESVYEVFKFLLYLCKRKRPLNISLAFLYIDKCDLQMHFHRLSMKACFKLRIRGDKLTTILNFMFVYL